MDRHARWRAQHMRRLRGADQRQVRESGELECERKQWGKKEMTGEMANQHKEVGQEEANRSGRPA